MPPSDQPYDLGMRRFAWFLILTLLLKLSMSMAVSAPEHTSLPTSPVPACHEHKGYASDAAVHSVPSDAATDHTAHGSSLGDCHQCCAVGLGMYTPLLPSTLPSSAPAHAWTQGTSLSPQPGLRPPIA